ncbi:LTA synthase family protein [Isobaculum melis]|uniref:Lipoteichoic acid synthase n=1 Tax=Isobaculum melis TaxID=142588 RepID=A0A1H9T7Y3_9LACT|nr:LTA synthase family protein [Isobaculum melis]SER93271.1 lipoteichoic acid synthase [Isobaculum melis]
MKKENFNIKKILNNRIGFFALALILFWAKTYIAYRTKFSLGVSGMMQHFLLLMNPISFALFLFGITFFSKGKKSYIMLLVIDLILTIWLFANIVYYREFSDFLTVNMIKSAGSVSANMDSSALSLMVPSDFFVFLDVIVLTGLLLFKVIKIDPTGLKKRYGFLTLAVAMTLFAANLGLAEMDRSGLLTRTFDRNYIVKYLGLNAFTVYDGVQTAQANAKRANADSSDMDEVLAYTQQNYAAPNPDYYGVAKGKNVIIIHLESFQQFLFDYKVDGQEVTPTLNQFYHDSQTMSFDNFFHQVGQGKTADAEMMLDNSLYGLSQGSAMVQVGTDNTYQAAPAILAQQGGYTSASFHGDVGSFWNRNNAYKSWGYDYFFDAQYYSENEAYKLGYGLKDKIFLKESAQYLEQLQQPFYAKLITVTNHYPYPLDEANAAFPKTTTGDSTVDGYVQTAHYLDQSINELMTYLKASGLYDNSVILMYGDHYGISGNHGEAVSQLLGTEEYNDYDDAMFQKVPLMIHMPGLKGGINHTFGGEIDVLPTLMHLLGMDNKEYVHFGSDLLSPEHQGLVAFRNGNFVAKDYTKVGSKVYDTATGTLIEHLTEEQKAQIEKEKEQVEKELSLSDQVQISDLLRYYTPSGFTPVDKSQYNYTYRFGMDLLKETSEELGDQSTSLLDQNKGQSTVEKYQTDAPELKE